MLIKTERRRGEQNGTLDYGRLGEPKLAVLDQKCNGDWEAGSLVPVSGSGLLIANAVREYLEAMRIPEQGEREAKLLAVSDKVLAIPDTYIPCVTYLKRDAARWVMDIVNAPGNKLPPHAVHTAHLAAIVRETTDSAVAEPLFVVLYPRIAPAERVELLGRIATLAFNSYSDWYLNDVIGKDDDLVERAVVERLRMLPADVKQEVVDKLFGVIYRSSVKMRRKVVTECENNTSYAKQVRCLKDQLAQAKE